MIAAETLTLLAPAFVAGVIIALIHVPLGREVLKRGIIFLDLAVAQCAALGMIAFQSLLAIDEYSYLGMYGPLAAGLIAALSCALAFHKLEKHAGRYQEALIGCAFVLAACLSLVIMANDPHGGDNMKNILAGQILWADWQDIKLAAAVFIAAALIWHFGKTKRNSLFYPLFALCIPFAVHLIGIYLVFASLIFPALAVTKISRHKTTYGIALTIAAYALGLMLSYLLDWSSGPAIVMALALCSILLFIISGQSKAYVTNN